MAPTHYRDKVIVLMYHYIVPSEEIESTRMISPERFAAQLDALQSDGYHVISMRHYVKFTQQAAEVPDNAVVITFDDGCSSFHRYAYPELLKRQLPATNFIVVRYADGLFDPNNQVVHLSWAQMKEMIPNGMSFNSHTYDQHRLSTTLARGHKQPILPSPVFLPPLQRFETEAEYRTRIFEDLRRADTLIRSELGYNDRILCFPYGEYSDAVIEIGTQLGIELYFTIEDGSNERHQKLVRRINAGSTGVSAQTLLEKIHRYDDC